MSARRILCLAAATFLLASPALAEPSELWKSCTGGPDVPWQQQIKACTAIIQAKTETPANLAIAYNNRGVAQLELRAGGMVLPDETAMADFGMAIKLNPNYADAYYNRGRLWFAAGVYHNAVDLYSYAIKLSPRHFNAHIQRAIAWAMMGEAEEARADLDAAIALNPKNAEAYYWRGAFRRDENADAALADLTEAIRLDPNYAIAYRDRAGIFVERNEFDRAASDFSAAIKAEPTNAAHYANRGYINFFRADFTAAAADLHRATELDPRSFNEVPTQILFRYVALARAGQNARAELEAASDAYYFGSNRRLFLGQANPQAVLHDAPPPTDHCQALFYVGQWHLIRNERDAARSHLKEAAAGPCEEVYPHRRAAIAELARMAP